MILPLVAVLTHQTGEVQIRRHELDAQFLMSFAAGPHERRFADMDAYFAAAGTPKTLVWLLRPSQQEHVVAFAKAIKQRGDFVRQDGGLRGHFRTSAFSAIFIKNNLRMASYPRSLGSSRFEKYQ